MQSPYGRRGAICKNLGWSWHYLHHNIPWATVQKILSDLPQYHYDHNTHTHSHRTIQLDTSTADQFINAINQQI